MPAGFALDNTDAPTPVAAGQISQYKVTIGVTQDKKTLVYKRSFFFGAGNYIIFPTASYAGLKQLFDAVNNRDSHTITLKIDTAEK